MPRIERVEQELKKELNSLIAYELNDPRINAVISVTRVETAKELKFARVFISVFSKDNHDDVLKILNNAAPYLRSLLFKRLKIREVPELNFVLDEGIQYSFKLDSILKEIKHTEE